MMKRFLICPFCSTKDRKEILGELDSLGNLIVQRYSRGTTKVVSNEMLVQCGKCNEIAFYKKDNARQAQNI